ncbi:MULTISPECIES: LacI family DNA-binding transcriptional regulator [Burkholderia]|uniref:LacI family transcriptional regulator n=1 Tax=Burkholderia savannae TaxID=1637837 RepID=A0ABR5TDY2_9BURK|nr:MULTISPECIES: LacI family DNA-binding transcriptional regulator [Burkholderia]AOJ68841.1 LacI family transcriptional regulator [Burkholderia savannae]AOJ80820.1 LacI family transcriptional regulator [Burkholderia savannae]KGS08596.1 bacterial regulatory s, lacI family protein [Burkholderia sp. ABCPW 111]KVG37780.1 LacI family transcriptional regulator [Burkholderia sp. MSMB0265]KVG78102.1 LacI family transcriptional regulator [Burkholderia sp. MSMB2040]
MTKQIPTLAHVARIAGVSQMTASRALNDRPGVSQETREEVLRIAADIGYVMNRSAQKLSGGRNGIIGIVTPMLDNQFVGELIVGVGRAARAGGYEILVYTVFDEDRHSHHGVLGLMKQFTDGVIAILPRESVYFDALAAARVPVVVIDQRGTLAGFPSVSVDNYGGALRAVEHLVELGHKRIAFVSGDESIEGVRDRRRGYLDAIARFNMPNDPALLVQGGLSQMKAFDVASQLLALPDPPTAIFAANDLSAFGVIAAVREAGKRVPGDISVIGFDDIPMASQVHPSLTTIRQPFPQMARAAVNTLVAQIDSPESVAPRIVLPAELVIRQSTGPASNRVESPQVR